MARADGGKAVVEDDKDRYLEARTKDPKAATNDAALGELQRGWVLGENGFVEPGGLQSTRFPSIFPLVNKSNPFPGMIPWLEAHWPGVHSLLIAYFSSAPNAPAPACAAKFSAPCCAAA